MESLWQDLRFSFRTLRAAPSFTVVAMLTLALGIGANGAMFSVVSETLLRAAPLVKEPDRLVVLVEARMAKALKTSHIRATSITAITIRPSLVWWPVPTRPLI